MTKWPNPVSQDVIERQREYAKTRLGDRSAKLYRDALTSSSIEQSRSAGQFRTSASKGRSKRAAARQVS